MERALTRSAAVPEDKASVLRRAVAAMAVEEGGPLGAGPLERRRVVSGLLRRLGAAEARCCGRPQQLQAVPQETARPTPTGLSREMATLFRHCAACHDGADRFPPGFLAGEGEGLKRQVAACAPRIAYRLAMGAVPAAGRSKTPMPPPASATGFAEGQDYRVLMAWLPALAGRPLESVLQGPYTGLPPCRPEPD